MRCAEFKEQVGAYALGALSPLQSAEMEHHLAELLDHEGCRDDLDRARLTVAKLSYTLDPVAPGERVWPRIEQRIGRHSGRAEPHRRETAAWAIAAAAIVALVLVNEERVRRSDRLGKSERQLVMAQGAVAERDRCVKELEQLKSGTSLERDAVALLELPATKVIVLKPVGGRAYQASAIVNLEQRRAIIVSTMPASADKDLELWVIRGKAAPEPAGFLRHFANGVVFGEVDREVLKGGAPDALAVSLEPLGGRPTPTEVLMAGALGG